MYTSRQSGSVSRGSFQQANEGKPGHRPKERGKKQHRESRRDKDTSHSALTPSRGDMELSAGSYEEVGQRRSGRFEMSITVSNRNDTEKDWLQFHEPSVQATPTVSPPFLSSVKDTEVHLMGELDGGKKPHDPKVPLWRREWRAGPLTCTIPRLYVPAPPIPPTCDTSSISSALDFPRDRAGNNLVLHCIDLYHYIQEIRDLLSALSEYKSMDTSSSESLPNKPVRFYNRDVKLLQPNDPLHLPMKIPALHLTKHTLNKAQRKAIAAICSFAGYNCSSPDALGTLSDLLGDFLSKLSKLLRINADCQSGAKGCLGFQDALERSLHQVGMEGKSGLYQYWQTSVQGHARRLEMEADEYRNSYLTLTIPEEKLKESSSVSTSLSSPLTNSKWPNNIPDDHYSSEDEVSIDLIIRQTKLNNAQMPVDIPPVTLEIMPPESEGFVPLEIDGPPRKRCNQKIQLTSLG